MPKNNPLNGDDQNSSERSQYSHRMMFLKTAGIAASLLLVIAVILAATGYVFPAFGVALASLLAAGWIFRVMLQIMREIRTMVNEITETTREQQEVISNFSHKIREPLNSLIVISDLLSDTNLNEKQKDLVETLIASGNNMVSTVNDLTMQSASGIASDKRREIKFSLSAAIRNTIELFNLSGKVIVDFSIKHDSEVEPEIIGDPIIIKQIVLDILNNIASQAPNTRPAIDIPTSVTGISDSDLNAGIRFSATNTILADMEGKENNFTAFKLISYSGGEYSYSTSYNQATINISLPFRKPAPERGFSTASPKIAELRKEAGSKKEMRDLNVLLVEDNMINQKITFLTLKPLVKSIDTANNGKEALDKVARTQYDIILMDIQMPVMNGLIASEKIRALEKSTGSHVPIIAITANAMLGDKEKCISAGMDDYISKPFQPAALIEKIKKYF